MVNSTVIFEDLPSIEFTMDCTNGKISVSAVERDIFQQLPFLLGAPGCCRLKVRVYQAPPFWVFGGVFAPIVSRLKFHVIK
jgi:hypothetical protein